MQLPGKNIIWINEFIKKLENVNSEKFQSTGKGVAAWNDLEHDKIQFLLKDTIYQLKQIIELELFKNTSHRFFFSLKLHLEFCENQLSKMERIDEKEIHDQHHGFLDEILCLNGLIRDSGLLQEQDFKVSDLHNSLYEIVEAYRTNAG